jgi:hypothetical protein
MLSEHIQVQFEGKKNMKTMKVGQLIPVYLYIDFPALKRIYMSRHISAAFIDIWH